MHSHINKGYVIRFVPQKTTCGQKLREVITPFGVENCQYQGHGQNVFAVSNLKLKYYASAI